MTDIMSWSLPLGRIAGITVRVHLLLIVFMISMVGRGANSTPSYALDALLLQVIVFFSILLHEFGHCFAARRVDGDADEILMWPLGGLASVHIPNVPRAHFVTVAGGPAVNVVLCFLSGIALAFACGVLPPFSPFWSPIAFSGGHITAQDLYSWYQGAMRSDLNPWEILLARVFYVNWMLFWFNMLLVGFPLDGGRLLQVFLWPRLGFHRATQIVCYSGFIIALVLSVLAVVFIDKNVDSPSNWLMMVFLAFFMYDTCRQQLQMLEAGALMDDSVFGYDFSQGYSSLERSQPKARRARPPFWRRWLQKRAEARRKREEEEFAEEQRRVDELLVKVQQGGIQALTAEEQRYLKRVSAKLRNRNRS
jgi:Zn-dependent protease